MQILAQAALAAKKIDSSHRNYSSKSLNKVVDGASRPTYYSTRTMSVSRNFAMCRCTCCCCACVCAGAGRLLT